MAASNGSCCSAIEGASAVGGVARASFRALTGKLVFAMSCELCEQDGGTVLWRDAECRIVHVVSGDYPGYLRVIAERHVGEMTDLAAPARERVMRAVFAAETALRELFRPDKVNLASLGNQTPHVHWHVLARFADDRHFPDSIWSAPRRAATRSRAAVSPSVLGARLAALLA